MVVSRCILSYVFPQLLAIACLTIAGFQLALSLLLFFCLSIIVNQSYNLAGGMAEPVDHHSQEETGDPAVCGRGLVFRRRFGRAWLVQVISSVLCEGVSIYDIYCRYAKQKNGCPFLTASIHPHLPDYQCSGVGLMAQRNGAQLWVKLTAGG